MKRIARTVPVSRRSCLGWGLGALAGVGKAGAADTPVTDVLEVAGSRIQLLWGSEPGDALRRETNIWVKRSAACVAGYLGQFPVATLVLRVQPVEGQGVSGGATFPRPQPNIRVRVGRDTTPARFLDDWVMVHEMVHLAIPDLPRSHNWLHEGLATYVETVARAHAGITSVGQLWGELARGLPQGQPQAGDRGLDHTATWGRTYWGGALFSLLADVQMHRQGDGRTGLRQALAGVLKAGGNYGVDWPVARTLAVADAAVGQTVLSDQYRKMKDQPVAVDLDALWRKLGVTQYQAGVNATLLDDAPWAAVRRAISA